MAAKSKSPGLDAEDEERTRTNESVGYDSELDDEYDTESGNEHQATQDEHAAGAKHEHLAGYRTDPAGSTEPIEPIEPSEDGEFGDEADEESKARATAESEPESFSDVGLAPTDRTADEVDPADELGQTDELSPDERVAHSHAHQGPDAFAAGVGGANQIQEPDPYQLGSPIPGQPNTGPVLIAPTSAPDSEPGLEHEAQYHHDPEIVGAAAEQPHYGDAGRDEADGRPDFDQVAAQEDVADYDDSAAGYELAAEQSPVQPAATQAGTTSSHALLPAETQDELLQRWTAIQVSFVDDPSASVRSADTLIRDISTAIQNAIHERTEQISGSSQGTADTEQLRLALQEYRSFLGVLLPK